MADNQQYGPLAPKKTSASDIRSVIANATKETGKGFTIANKEEIEQKKQDNGLNVKVSNGVKTNPKVELTNNTKPTSVINTPTQKKEAPTGPVVSPVVSASQLTGDVFKNPQLQPIENIKVQKNNDEPKLSNSYTNYHLNKDEIRNMLVESQEDKIKRKSEGIEKLYIDAYRKKKNGEVLTIEEVLGNANYQKELNGIEQGKLQEMINDANAIANAGKFNMDNVIPLFEKYQDEGIQVDYNKLSPQSKAQFVGDMLNNKQSTIGKIISLGTPLGQINSLKELITGKSFLDDIQDAIIDLENTSHKNLTDKEADKIASKQIKELDEGFKDFYDMGKKSPSLIDYVTNIEDAPKMYYENKYGVAKDQKIWKDKEKEREYNEKLDEIRRLVKEQHGDTPENVAKNTLIGSAKALLTVYNMASDLPGFGKMIFDLGGGGIEDFVGSAVSLGKTAYDTAKYGAETGDFEVQWDAKDIRQRVAESGGYDNYKDMVAKLEKEWGDNPLGQFAVWSLKNADTSMDTANALGNYFMEKYGSLDKGWTAFKNDPVEVISDWMPAMQFKVSLLNKLGFISDLNATKILNASRWLDAYDKPFELANKLQFGPLLKAEGKLLGGISKLGLNSIKLPVKAVASITDAVISKLTGIDKESRNYIRENGDAVLDYVNGKETSDGILREITDKFDELTDEKKQIGEEYNIIKESDVPINSKSVMDDIYSKLSEYGVKINTDGSVEFSKILPTSIKGKVNELVSYINDFQKKGDRPSASDTHYFRQLVDNLTNWDNPNPKGLDAQFINTLKDIRKTIDGALKEQVPGMREADAAYSKTVSLIQELKKDWFNKDGTLKDGAYSKIRNLTNKGSNQPKLERLEKIIPGITEKLKSLAVSEVIERGMKQATGQYLNQLGLGGSVFSLFTGGVSLTPMVLGILGANLATPKNFAHLLRFEGKVTKPIRNLADKIKNGNKLNAKETKDLVDFMLDNKEELKETAKYMNERGLFDEGRKTETPVNEKKNEKKTNVVKQNESKYEKRVSNIEKEATNGNAGYQDIVKLKKEISNDNSLATTDRIKLLERVNNALKKQKDANYDDAIRLNYKDGLVKKEELINNNKIEKKLIDFVKSKLKATNGDVKIFKELPEGQYGDYVNNLIRYIENPTDTTHGHELLHYTMDFMDRPTHDYILEKVRGELNKKLGRDIDLFSAEEYIAEKYGIYLRKHVLDFGALNKDKTFIQRVKKLFDDVRYYFKSLAGDNTLEKLFREITYKDQKLNKEGRFDFSFLIEGKLPKKKLGLDIGLKDKGRKYKSVYHGSPADFDKFDSSHMGEGEGNQAHGWGHYVAVNKDTANKYAELNYVGDKYGYKGQSWYDLWEKSDPYEKNVNYKDKMAEYVLRLQDGDTPGKTNKIEDAYKLVKEEKELDYRHYLRQLEVGEEEMAKTGKSRYNLDSVRKQLDKTKKELDAINELSVDDFKVIRGRNLYNLEIPDPIKKYTPTGSNYLEENPHSSDPNFMKAFITDEQQLEFSKLLSREDKDAGRKFSNRISRLYGNKNMVGGDLYKELSSALGSDKAASQFLNKIGYDGIHYYGGRDGEAYVIFNDNALQIKDHIRYKKKIGDKDVEITPKVKSPDELIEKNADGLSVMKSFISGKQAEKALNVNKVLLDKDGNPYLWTHTNKYDAPQFANFENTKDSKYKEFGDYEIAWFSNSEDMSRSYANQESKLADTKPINSIEEFNDRFSKYDIDGTPYDTEWKKGDNKEWKYGHKTSIDKEGNEYVLNQYDSESHKYKDLETLYNEWHNGGYDGQSEKEVIDGIKKLVHEEFIDSPDFRLYDDVDIKKEKDGYVLTTSSKKELGRYKSEQEALAKSTAKKHVSGKYHYQGIITDIKNPLVVDLGKYKPGEIKRFRDGDKIVGEHGRYWSDLGNAYEFVKKEQPNVDEIFSKVEKEWGGAKKASNDIKYYAFDIEREGDNLYKAYKDMEEGPAKKFAEDRLMAYRKAGDIIGYISRGVVDELKPEWRNLRVESDGKTTTIGNLYDKAISEYNKYKDVFDVFGEGNRIWKESGKYSQPEGYDKSKTKNFINLLKKNGMGEGAISILHGTDLMNRIDLVYSPFASEGWAITKLRDKSLQTNDYVFYALRKGGYDGVLFKDIVDYGGKGDNKGGDVLAAFKSSDFKAWDNANPTDSKYISYKKKVSLDKKPEGLSKKDSNGLLAKGRERTLGNNGMRYKTNISEKDSSGKKLSEGQKKFFAGSKVVDKDGNLLRVYHGTLAGDFTVFQKYGNRASNNIASDVGFWFTPNKKGAINFAKESSWRGDNKARAEEVYLDIKNPKVYEPSEFNLKDYEERDKLIDSKYKEVYAARNEMNKYDYNYFWMGEYTHGNHVNRGIFNKLDYIYNQKGKITEADLKDIKEEYGKINWNGYYKPEIDATYEDFKNYLQAKKKYDKLNDEYLEMKHSDSYDDFKADIYKLDNKKRDKLDYALDDMDAAKKYIDNLKKEGYDGIIIKGTEYDGATLGEGARNDQYVAFDSNQIKRITNENPTKNEDIRYKKGYHGSKYDFDKFSSEHIGEGEGNQAHGYGLYIAGTKKTAKGYAQMGGNPRLSYKGLNRDELADRLIDAKLDGREYPDSIANAIITRIEDNGLSFKEAKKEAIKTFSNIADEYKANGEMDKYNATKQEIGTLEGLKRKDFEMKKGRHLYTVDIPDVKDANTPSGKNYLNEEKLYGKKVYEKIFEEARKNPNFVNEKGFDYYINDKLKFRGKNQMYGVWINKALESGFGNNQKAVAEFLKGLGYEGIEYKGLQDGKAYVIFDDKNIDIKDHIRYKKQTDTPEFKKWFEGSKVVDKEGKPLEVYHGSTATFNVFDKNKIGKNAKKVGPGFYFTDVKAEADAYQKHYNALKDKYENYEVDKPRTISAYLDIKNPIRIGEDVLSKEQMVKILNQGDYEWAFNNWLPGKIESINELNIKKINGKSYTPEEVRNMSKEQKIDLYVDKLIQDSRGKDDLMLKFLEEVSQVYHYDNKGRVLDVLKDVTGNDGVIYEQVSKWNPDRKYPTQYVAWESNQIKSATDNIGTFDKNNPDIRYKKGLEKKSDDGIRYKGNSLPVHKLGDVGLENEYGLKKIEGNKPYKLTNGTRQEMEKGLNKIMRNLRNDAVAGGVVPGNYNKGTPIENALNSLRKINWDKENIEDIETLRGVWRGKDYSIAQIIKLIDSGNGDGMRYRWYWDKKEGMPTVIFWKGNQYKAIGDKKYWAFHTNKNNITSPTMQSSLNNKGKLRPSPLRR